MPMARKKAWMCGKGIRRGPHPPANPPKRWIEFGLGCVMLDETTEGCGVSEKENCDSDGLGQSVSSESTRRHGQLRRETRPI